MGLIKDIVGAGLGAGSNVIHSSLWKEYFVSGDMSGGVLMTRGQKVSTANNKNTKTDDNLISSGSGIDVQEGQCAIIVDNGAIVDFCMEAGRYTYDASTSPSLLSGNNKGLAAMAKEFVNQFAAGGQRFSTQRIYFINTGMIWEPLKWGCGNVGFTHSFQPNPNINPIRVSTMMKAHGTISIHIDNPVTFYKAYGAQLAGGDNSGRMTMASLANTIMTGIKTGLNSGIATAISNISRNNPCSYTELMSYHGQIEEEVSTALARTSFVQSGFGFMDFFISGTPELRDQDYKRIEELEEKHNMVADPMLAAYGIQSTMAEGFKEAGKNGGISGIMGMGMMMPGGAMGMNGMGNFQGYQQQPVQQPAAPVQPAVAPVVAPAPQMPSGDSWTCACGHTNTGKFCMECGTAKPEPIADNSWTCACGTVNTGKFCHNCGSKKPEPKKSLHCDKCGWVAPEGTITKFCPNCGDPVTADDFQ